MLHQAFLCYCRHRRITTAGLLPPSSFLSHQGRGPLAMKRLLVTQKVVRRRQRRSLSLLLRLLGSSVVLLDNGRRPLFAALPFQAFFPPSPSSSFSGSQRCRLQQHSIRAFKGAPKRELELETAAKAFEDNASKGESTPSFSLGAAASPLFPLSSSFSSFPPLSFVHFRPSEEKKERSRSRRTFVHFLWRRDGPSKS